MEWLREWALAVCTVSVIGAAVTLLSPDGRHEKLVNMCVSVLLLVAVVTPFKELDGCSASDLTICAQEYDCQESSLEQCVEEQSSRYLVLTAESLIEARLAQDGLFAEEILVIMDRADNGCISIGQVTITMNTDEADIFESTRQAISQWLGVENVEVTGGMNEQDQGIY